jgi:hypothetical protein|tara:strand:- start:81 stop:566 length:486 start_codon:yes stop_codon:yes gene_type:complete
MNIFYFDECPTESAQAQPDKMLVKMPLETAQMLCTAHRELDGNEYADEQGLYKRAYWNHPCTIWARESSANYFWLYKHFLALGREYTFRYGKIHKSVDKLSRALFKQPDNISRIGMTTLAQAMPDEYKHDDPTVAYRDYVIHEKHYAKWEQGRDKPEWWAS